MAAMAVHSDLSRPFESRVGHDGLMEGLAGPTKNVGRKVTLFL